MTLPAEQFIGRFLMHLLPDRFLRIRHYGFLANRDKRKSLARCRTLLGAPTPATPEDPPRTLDDWLRDVLGVDPLQCPCCGHVLHRVPLPRGAAAALAPAKSVTPWDTS